MILKKYLKILLILSVSSLISCTSASRFYTKEKKGENPRIENSREISKENKTFSSLESVTGVASFYADKFHGKQTANGEIYDMHSLTAAHLDYPFNTQVRVTNLSNSLSVVVRINDRKPYDDGRIIDLSYGAAGEIDMINSGIAKVKMEVLEWGQ
jgi:rare lipoprotein A